LYAKAIAIMIQRKFGSCFRKNPICLDYKH